MFTLNFGPGFDLHKLKSALPHALAQPRAQFGWIEQRLAGDRDFVLGAFPGLPDALRYYLVWFIPGRYAGGSEFLQQLLHLHAWEQQRAAAIGHGDPSWRLSQRRQA